MQRTPRNKTSGSRPARSKDVNSGRGGGAVAAKSAAVAPDKWLDAFIPYHLYRVTNKLNARLQKRLKAARINSSQWRVLSVLRAYGSMSISQIVETTLMEQPTTSRVVAELERIGHVQRRTSELDSRTAEISITAAGLEAFNGIVPFALKHQSQAFRDMDAKELALLVDLLKRIEYNVALND